VIVAVSLDLRRICYVDFISLTSAQYHQFMDTASQVVRAKYEELLDGEIGLADFEMWIMALPFPSAPHPDFRAFIALVVRAQTRLMLWHEGAPDSAVVDSLALVLREAGTPSRVRGIDPLEPYKRRFTKRLPESEQDRGRGLW
jgi:hypothetical protein